ncbi:MAG: acetate--CoA ligase family protein, partial [Alphaproteobacteria bacterium]
MIAPLVRTEVLHGPGLHGPHDLVVAHLAGGDGGTAVDGAWHARWRALCAQLDIAATAPAAPAPATHYMAATLVALLSRQGADARAEVAADRVTVECALDDPPRSAVELAHFLVSHVASDDPPIARIGEGLRHIRGPGAAGGHTIADLAQLGRACSARGIPWRRSRLIADTLLVGEGVRQRRFHGGHPAWTGLGGARVTKDKIATKHLLEGFGLPVLPHRVTESVDDALAAATRIGWPVVVKPVDGSLGRGVTIDIRDESLLRVAVSRALRAGSAAMIEPYLATPDYRAYTVGRDIPLAFRRNGPYVVGDGTATVAALVEAHNRAVAAGTQRFPSDYPVAIDEEMREMLAAQGLFLDAVPAADRRVELRSLPLRTRGGWLDDVTDAVHPATASMLLRVAEVLELSMTAIDIRAEDIARPWNTQRFAILEVNAVPNLAGVGDGRIGRAIIAADVSDPGAMRLPTVLTLGPWTDGSAARVAARLAGQGLACGVAGPDGVYSGRHRIAGPMPLRRAHERLVEDPTVAAALHLASYATVAAHGLGIPRFDVALLAPPPPGGSAEAVAALAYRHADRIEPLVGNDLQATVGQIAAVVRGLVGP